MRVSLVVVGLIPGVLALTPSASQGAGSVPLQVRVDQIGYPTASAKAAYLMSPHRCAGTHFSVTAASGAVVATGSAGPSEGSWSPRYGYVCPLAFDAVTASGTYRVSAGSAVSPAVVVAPASSLWVGALSNSVSYYANQRDGSAYLRSALRTAPAHLADSTALAYLTPTMTRQVGSPATWHLRVSGLMSRGAGGMPVTISNSYRPLPIPSTPWASASAILPAGWAQVLATQT
jgi:hypothetical protein